MESSDHLKNRAKPKSQTGRTKKIKEKKIKLLTLITIFTLMVSTTLTSCMTTKTSVGAYRETQGNEYTYAKEKQIWLFWGLMPLGRTSVNTPSDGNC